MNPDLELFHLLNNLAGTSPFLDWLVRAVGNDYAVPTLFALILGGLWFSGSTEEERRLNQRAVIAVLVGIAVTNASIRLLQANYFRPRPFATEQVKLLFYRPSVSSFPSVPVATMFCYVAAFWGGNRKWGKVYLALAIIFGLARVIAGVHYPSDIIGGAVWGIIGTWLPLRYLVFLNPLFNRLIGVGRRLNLA